MTKYYFLITFENINHPRDDDEIKKVLLKANTEAEAWRKVLKRVELYIKLVKEAENKTLSLVKMELEDVF